MDQILNPNFSKKFKHQSQSMFTQSFVNDCIMIFNELKRKPKHAANKFSITVQSGGPLSSNQDDLEKTQGSHSIGGKQINNATFKGT